MLSKNKIYFVLVLIILFLLGGTVFFFNLKQKKPLVVCPEIAPACGNLKEECLKSAESLEKQYRGCDYKKICETCKYNQINELQEESEIKKLLDLFVQRMQLITLASPLERIKEMIKDAYHELVTEELLNQWLNSPQEAPGKITSSPWPDKIEIKKLSKINPNEYQVEGSLIWMTSTGFAKEDKVEIKILKKDSKWLLAEYKVQEKQSSKGDCFVGGCAREICSDEPVGQRYCFWYEPKWDCYKTALCERQADGKCGWTMTPELKECLEKAEMKLKEGVQKDLQKDSQNCGPKPSAPGNWFCKDGAWRLNLLLNSGFEELVLDKDKTFDPANWQVTEGKTEVIYRDGTRYGTDRVIEEWPELIQVVNEENKIRSPEGQKMVKIDARIYLKTNFRQYYPEPIKEGKLVQEIYIYPQSKEYLQQIEIRGKKDEGIGGKRDEEGVRGNQLFSLKYSNEKMMLVVTTGKEWERGRHIIWKEFEPLLQNQWSLIKIILEKAESTKDELNRTISQWKLSLYLNGKLLYQSGRKDEPYVQYFQSADFIVIGDDYVLPEDKPADKNKMGPTTGDSFGVVYYDSAFAWKE